MSIDRLRNLWNQYKTTETYYQDAYMEDIFSKYFHGGCSKPALRSFATLRLVPVWNFYTLFKKSITLVFSFQACALNFATLSFRACLERFKLIKKVLHCFLSSKQARRLSVAKSSAQAWNSSRAGTTVHNRANALVHNHSCADAV